MKKIKKWHKDDDRSGLFIPACLFIGVGIGFITDHITGGIFLGLGLGFLATALFRKKKK